ncbi:MAG: TlpA disulfide reductase family protein [Thiotrichaceae bacterium]
MKLTNTFNSMHTLTFLAKVLVTFTLLVFSVSASAADSETVEDFSFNDIKGKTHKFSDYRGKWVLVNYWGTYCPPCIEEIPDLVRFADKHKSDAVILGMDAGGTNVADLTDFAEENMMDYLIAPVQESTLTAFGVLMGIPTTYVVTPTGHVAARVVGIIDLVAVEQMMQQYAGVPSAKEKESEGILEL